MNPFEALAPTDRYLETPYGRLYRPVSHGRQILTLVACFFASFGIGWAIGEIAGDLSELAQALVTAPFVLVFFFGYAAWVARTSALATRYLGLPLLKAFYLLLIKRGAPKTIEELIPSREKLLEIAVKAQAGGSSFRRVGYPLAGIFGLAATQIETAMGGTAIALLLAVTTVGWGILLGSLGRRGWLPFVED